MKKRIVAMMLTLSMVGTLVVGCGASETDTSSSESSDTVSTSSEEDSDSLAGTTITYWTWYPELEAYEPVIEAFTEETGINVEITIMESVDYQTKLPLALASGEQIDVIGVQDAMVTGVESFLEPVEPLISEIDEDWRDKIVDYALEDFEMMTSGELSVLSAGHVADWFIYYNADMTSELGLEEPTTFAEWEVWCDTIREAYPECIPYGFWGSVSHIYYSHASIFSGQTSDYYNDILFENATFDDPDYIYGIQALLDMFDSSIVSYDEVGDLTKARVVELFAEGGVASFNDGTWSACMLTSEWREENGIDFEIGAFALPTAEEEGTTSVRSYLNQGFGVVNYSENKEAAMQFMYYMTCGEGSTMLGDQQYFMSTVEGYEADLSVFTDEVGLQGYMNMVEAFEDYSNISRCMIQIATLEQTDLGAVIVNALIEGNTDAEDIAAQMEEASEFYE